MFLLVMVMWSCSVLFAQDSWVKTFGVIGESDHSYSVTKTQNGGYCLTGRTTTFYNTPNGNLARSFDVIVVRCDSVGNIVWTTSFGGTDDDCGYSIVTTFDNGFILTGTTRSFDGDFEGMSKGVNNNGVNTDEIFVVRLDSNGKIVWKKTFGGTNQDDGKSLRITSDDGVILTGQTCSNDGDFDGLNKGCDVFVMKLDSSGEIVWKKIIGYSSDTTGGGRGNSIVVTPDSGLVVIGDYVVMTVNQRKVDVFVVKLDYNGKVLWKKTFGGSEDDIGESINVTTDGSLVITGWSHSNNGDFVGLNRDFLRPEIRNDIFVFKLDSLGKLVWKKSFGGRSKDESYSITNNDDNSCTITGRTSSSDGDFEGLNRRGNSGSSGPWDLFVIRIESDGNTRWKKVYGGTNNEDGSSVVSSRNGASVITGSFNSYDYDFDGLYRKAGTGRVSEPPDIFLIKLDSNGILNSTTSVNDESTSSTKLFVSPNPLSSSSTITYTIQKPSRVRIELMNTLGQVSDVVFDGYSESGTHSLSLNTTSITSGMYWFRMTNGTGVQTTQVSVVR